tara:strand:+ start:664 stop:1095 length:432 start_codon:yes stop_codon:yes gene_type:complete
MFFRKSKPKKSENVEKEVKSPDPKTYLFNDNNDTKKNVIEPKVSTISQGLDITGSVVSKGKIRFNGLIKGTLEAKSLYVGEDGFIDGKATADEAVILGNIKGSLKGKKVRLAATSRIEGDTYHEVIAIEDGAIYEGSIKRIKS